MDYRPNAKQTLFHKCGADEVVYGGAKGGGKSFALVMDAFAYSQRNAGSRIYLFRETYDALEANLIDCWKSNIPYENELWKYRAQNHTIELQNGSIVYFRYVTNKDDAMKYNGRSIDYVGVDELTFYDEDWIEILRSCVRSPKGYHAVFKGTCNPGGRGHNWVKKRYVDATNHGLNIVKDNASGNTICFIPATVRDNTVLMKNDPRYVKRLENLPDAQREAYLNGNWDIFEGQYFSEWDRKIHCCKPFPVPEHWTRYVAMDYGMDMFACYDIAVDEQGRAYVIDEIYKSGLIVSNAVSEMMAKFRKPALAYIAPPDLWNKHSDTGRSTAEIFASFGVYLTKASNNRVQGWLDLREWLKPYKDEQGVTTSRLQVFETCANLARCIPMLQYDPNNNNDVAKNPHEVTHAPDALRYFISGRPMNVQLTQPQEELDYENEIEELCNYGI